MDWKDDVYRHDHARQLLNDLLKMIEKVNEKAEDLRHYLYWETHTYDPEHPEYPTGEYPPGHPNDATKRTDCPLNLDKPEQYQLLE
jgi:hypothetical protein